MGAFAGCTLGHAVLGVCRNASSRPGVGSAMSAGVARRRSWISIAAVAAVSGVLVVAATIPGTGSVQAYDPAPQPTATAEPAPTPTPTPTPTIAPALPPEPNDVRNPPNPEIPQVVVPGVLEVSRVTALRTPPRYYVFESTPRLRDAPRADRRVNGEFVPIYNAGDVVRLVARVPADTNFLVYIRRQGRGNEYGEPVPALSDPNGRMALPALRVSRQGTYIVAMVNPLTGETLYLKIDVGPREQD